MQKLMEAYQACHKQGDKREMLDKCPKEAIEIIIADTKQACKEKIMKLPARGDMRRMALQAIDDVK